MHKTAKFFIISSATLFTAFFFAFVVVPMNSRAATADIPEILPRSTWENDETLEKLLTWIPERTTKSKASAADDNSGNEAEDENAASIPDYFQLSRIVLHDQGCVDPKKCNDDSVDPITAIQNIYRFHAVTRGWGDIGYHFIIDRKGNIYEGRFGGFEVRGAHLYADRTCQNYNLGTIGILLLGDYENDPVPEVMEDAVARLSAWLATAAGLDPSDLSLKTDVWTNGTDGKKPNGFPRCDLSKGDFSSSYKGPVILTHRDVEKGNSDVQNIDLDAIREEAASLAKTFASLIFKDASKSAYYLLGDRKISSISKPSSTNKVVTVSSTQLNYFPLAKISLYADGSLLRAIGSKDVFLIQDKQRHHVSSASLFEQLGLKWSDIQEVNREVVLAHKVGGSITFPPGTLIRSLATKRVFYVGAEGRYWIPRESMYGVYGLSPATIIDLT